MEAIYAVYTGWDSALDVKSVEGLNVQTVRVNLKAKTDSADIGRFSLRDDLGNVVPIILATVGGDGGRYCSRRATRTRTARIT